MKKYSILLFGLLTGILFLSQSCKEQSPDSGQTIVTDTTGKTTVVTHTDEKPDADLPVTSVKWIENSHDFGEVQYDKPAKHRFEFVNTGTVDLVISNVKPSCQCTTPSWSKEPVKPGEKGFVEAEFNSKSNGVFKKSVTVTANTEPKTTILNISGTVSGEEVKK